MRVENRHNGNPNLPNKIGLSRNLLVLFFVILQVLILVKLVAIGGLILCFDIVSISCTHEHSHENYFSFIDNYLSK